MAFPLVFEESEMYRCESSDQARVPFMKKIGAGAYGCVVQPESKSEIVPPCPDLPWNSNTVVKVQSSKYAKEELESAERLQRIDPDKSYFLTPDSSCGFRLDPGTPFSDAFLRTCEKNKPPITGDVTAIAFPYGGMDLDSFLGHVRNPNSFFQTVAKHPHALRVLLDAFIHLFDGLALLHKRAATFRSSFTKRMHYTHLDISVRNIVVSPRKDGSLNARFIDFGTDSRFGNQVDVSVLGLPGPVRSPEFWQRATLPLYYPPDAAVFRAGAQGIPVQPRQLPDLNKFASLIRKVAGKFVRDRMTGPIEDVLRHMETFDAEMAFKQAVADTAGIMRVVRKPEVKFEVFPFEKIDVYQLALAGIYAFAIALPLSAIADKSVADPEKAADNYTANRFTAEWALFVFQSCLTWDAFARPTAAEVASRLRIARAAPALNLEPGIDFGFGLGLEFGGRDRARVRARGRRRAQTRPFRNS